MTGPAVAAEVWATLDEPWREAFRQAWAALRPGNIPVGACAATPDGRIVHSARNRVTDTAGPPGEVFGSSLAHAEINWPPWRSTRRSATSAPSPRAGARPADVRKCPIRGVRW